MASVVEDLSRKRVRDDSDSDEHNSDSADVKRLREDLLGFLDDSYPDPATQDLDSVIRSLEEEISPASSSPAPVVDLTSDSGESQPQLGYLLEASDDELGLPPPTSEEFPADETDLVPVSSASSGMGEIWGFDEQFPSYDSFEFGTGDNYTGNDEYVALDGLFEYSDACFDSTDFSWRPETIPAQ